MNATATETVADCQYTIHSSTTKETQHVKVLTTAPIPLEDLKKYFEDNSISFEIDYDNSAIKGAKLMVYLSNLDLPCDLSFSTQETLCEMVGLYMESTSLVNVPTLERVAVCVMLHTKGMLEDDTIATISKSIPPSVIQSWVERLDSMTVFNMTVIPCDDIKQWALTFPIDDTDTAQGINFVNMFKHEQFFSFYERINPANLKYFSKYFNDYVCKGKHLISYWAVPSNPMFLLTAGIASGVLTADQYAESANREIET